jgi:HD-like signal output (HDOD) protein
MTAEERIQVEGVDGSSSGVVAVSSDAKRRILFVDDEPAILDGLRSSLRRQRHEWEMTFALGGVAALAEVERQAFDVIVTDMRMPVLDGAELLRQVKTLQPQMVRIVLTGQTDAETAMKTVFTAHQFLCKPCDSERLREVVRRACGLNALVFSEELRTRAGDISLLPAAPGTYLAISRALADPACGIADVARLVEREPALCAKVLQVVNSAFFGLPRSVSSVAQATSYLGTLTLRNLALAMEAVASSESAGLGLSPDELRAFQTNALLTAFLGRRWYAADRRRADEAFVAGMLRDMGHLVSSAPAPAAPSPPDTHGALGAYLLGLWGIPHAVLEPVAFHEQPELVEHDNLDVLDVVHLADRIASELAPSPFQRAPSELDLERLQRLGASGEQVQALRAEAPRLLGQARELLG